MEYFKVLWRKESRIVKAKSISHAIGGVFNQVHNPAYRVKLYEFTTERVKYNIRVYVDRKSIGTAMTIEEAMEMIDKSLIGKDFEFRDPCGTLIYQDFIG